MICSGGKKYGKYVFELERATAEARKRASTGASYSTSKARRQRAEKVSQKEAKREKTRAARNKAKDRQEL